MRQVSDEDGPAVALRWNMGRPFGQIVSHPRRFRYRGSAYPYLASDDLAEYTVRLFTSGWGILRQILRGDTEEWVSP